MVNEMSRGFSISMRSAVSYPETVQRLRDELGRHGFEVLSELPLHRELERKAGLRWKQLGMDWSRYTVLVVWSPSDACPALLSDRDGGLLVAFNLCIAEKKGMIIISAANHYGALKAGDASLGVQVLARDQAHRIRNVFSELALQNEVVHTA